MKNTKELFLEINEEKIYYDDFGKGQTPIIFIHGFPFDKSSWKPQMQFFRKTHRVIAYDIRSFGKSSNQLEKTSITIYAQDLIKFMDALHIEKAIVCGLSMGGYILLNAVHNNPDRFDAIILCDTKCEADNEEAKTKRYASIEAIKTNGIEDFILEFINKIFCQNTLNNYTKLVAKVREMMLATPQATVVTALVALAERAEMCSMLHNINLPTLIVCGQEDALTPAVHSSYLHENIKKSILYFIDNAGHLPNLEQSSQFNKILLDFILEKPHLVPTPLYGNEFVRVLPLFEK